jgi:hypothetical protein
MNANFADNAVNGVIKDRNAIDLSITSNSTSPVFNNGTGVRLEDVVLAKGDILVNSTFTGTPERAGEIDPAKTAVGSYGGVIGELNGSSIAGALHLEERKVFHRADDFIPGVIERGIFVLDQCGLTATAGGDCLDSIFKCNV